MSQLRDEIVLLFTNCNQHWDLQIYASVALESAWFPPGKPMWQRDISSIRTSIRMKPTPSDDSASYSRQMLYFGLCFKIGTYMHCQTLLSKRLTNLNRKKVKQLPKSKTWNLACIITRRFKKDSTWSRKVSHKIIENIKDSKQGLSKNPTKVNSFIILMLPLLILAWKQGQQLDLWDDRFSLQQ